jgi:hypothetical protein
MKVILETRREPYILYLHFYYFDTHERISHFTPYEVKIEIVIINNSTTVNKTNNTCRHRCIYTAKTFLTAHTYSKRISFYNHVQLIVKHVTGNR